MKFHLSFHYQGETESTWLVKPNLVMILLASVYSSDYGHSCCAFIRKISHFKEEIDRHLQLHMDLDVVPRLEGEHERPYFDKKVKSVIAFFLSCSDKYIARENRS